MCVLRFSLLAGPGAVPNKVSSLELGDAAQLASKCTKEDREEEYQKARDDDWSGIEIVVRRVVVVIVIVIARVVVIVAVVVVVGATIVVIVAVVVVIAVAVIVVVALKPSFLLSLSAEG